jgi:hypothetical protein
MRLLFAAAIASACSMLTSKTPANADGEEKKKKTNTHAPAKIASVVRSLAFIFKAHFSFSLPWKF